MLQISSRKSAERRMRLFLCIAVVVFEMVLFPPFLFCRTFKPSAEDERLLDEIQRRAFDYFVEEHHPKTGLVKDKASNHGADSNVISSIAATGFGLTAMCVGVERGWISKEEAGRYCRKVLRFFLYQLQHHHGFFYHFVHWGTGERTNTTEISSIDTALFLAGALTAGEYFKGTEIEKLAHEIYGKVDFAWMLNGGKTLCMGWHPDQGFLKPRWDHYCESLILYLLAVGSPTHPIPSESWHEVKKRIGTYGSHVLIYSPSLFTHQYSHVWMDLRDKNDGFADYFENSRVATLVNRQFCLDQRKKYKTYSGNVWGLTASLGPEGYRAYGSEPGGAIHDGTVAPTAAGSSIVFTPRLSLNALRFMHDHLKEKIWGKYGFSDAFNRNRDWYAREVLGIDQGPLLLMIENFRTQMIWKLFMRHPSVVEGMERLGFKSGTLPVRLPQRPLVKIRPPARKIRIDGQLKDWDLKDPLRIDPSRHLDRHEVSGASDVQGRLFFSWTPRFLYVAARIRDDSLVMTKKGDKIWKDDCLELFLDPDDDGLRWGKPKDIQIGLSPGEWENEGRTWAWFQGFDPAARGWMKLRVRRKIDGYDLEARISWKFLKISPRVNLHFGLTPAIHDIDGDGTEGKLNWFFLPDGKSGTVTLGKARLEGRKVKERLRSAVTSTG